MRTHPVASRTPRTVVVCTMSSAGWSCLSLGGENDVHRLYPPWPQSIYEHDLGVSSGQPPELKIPTGNKSFHPSLQTKIVVPNASSLGKGEVRHSERPGPRVFLLVGKANARCFLGKRNVQFPTTNLATPRARPTSQVMLVLQRACNRWGRCVLQAARDTLRRGNFSQRRSPLWATHTSLQYPGGATNGHGRAYSHPHTPATVIGC